MNRTVRYEERQFAEPPQFGRPAKGRIVIQDQGNRSVTGASEFGRCRNLDPAEAGSHI